MSATGAGPDGQHPHPGTPHRQGWALGGGCHGMRMGNGDEGLGSKDEGSRVRVGWIGCCCWKRSCTCVPWGPVSREGLCPGQGITCHEGHEEQAAEQAVGELGSCTHIFSCRESRGRA